MMADYSVGRKGNVTASRLIEKRRKNGVSRLNVREYKNDGKSLGWEGENDGN